MAELPNALVDEIAEQIARSKRIDAWLYSNSNGVTAEHTPRVIMSASSYQLAMDTIEPSLGLSKATFGDQRLLC